MFELTTDASQHGLSQNKRPITMISKTLCKDEKPLAANVKELLAIECGVKIK